MAELFSPGAELDPVFIVSPVKAEKNGERVPVWFGDGSYYAIRDRHCIFHDSSEMSCRIYEKRPFGCGVLLCAHMTGSDPVVLRKSFYYNKWLEHQYLIYEMIPQLEESFLELRAAASPGREGVAEISRYLNGSGLMCDVH